MPLRPVRISKFIKEPSKIVWLVEDLLPNIGWTLLVGRKGHGKTTFAMQLSAAIYEGKEFLGRQTTQTEILYIQADSPTEEWKVMLQRIAPSCDGITMVDVPGQCLANPAYVEHIDTVVEKVNPGFIIFDSLYKLTNPGIINTDKVLGTIQTMSDLAKNRPWMLIHHPPHSESRAAGHSSIEANCSNEWILKRTSTSSEKYVLQMEKGRLLKGVDIKLQKNEEGLWEEREEDSGMRGDDPIFSKPIA